MIGFKFTKITEINYKEKVSWSFRSLGSGSLYKRGDSRSFPRIEDLTYSYLPNQCVIVTSHLMVSNTKILSLNHLAMARTSHLVLAIQGDP